MGPFWFIYPRLFFPISFILSSIHSFAHLSPRVLQCFPSSPQCVLLWPLYRVEKAASHSGGEAVSIQSVAWLSLFVMSCSKGTSSVRGFGGISYYNIPVTLFGTLSVILSPFLG